MNHAAGLYLISCRANAHVYVGSTIRLSARLRHHKWQLRRGTHGNAHLQAAWRAYGADAFTFRPVAVLDARDTGALRAAETRLIAAYKASGVALFNARDDAVATPTFDETVREKLRTARRARAISDETRERMSASARARTLPPMTEDHCRKISAAKKGKPLSAANLAGIRAAAKRRGPPSPESIAKRAAKLRGRHLSAAQRELLSISRRGAGNPQFGKPVSPETRAKMSASHAGRKANPETRARITAAAVAREAAKKAERDAVRVGALG